MKTFEEIRRIVADEVGIDESDIEPSTPLSELTDSLEMAALLLELETALGIEIPDDDAQKLLAVQDVVIYANSRSRLN